LLFLEAFLGAGGLGSAIGGNQLANCHGWEAEMGFAN